MRVYYKDRFLFVDMRHKYTHCVTAGDMILCCRTSRRAAEETAEDIRRQKYDYITQLRRELNRDELYSPDRVSPIEHRIRDSYGSDAHIAAAIARVQQSADSIRVEELTVKDDCGNCGQAIDWGEQTAQ